MSTSSTLDALRPHAPDRLSRGALLAVLAHIGLLIALTLGVNWRSSEPAGVEAELWAALPQVAAPRVEPPPLPKLEPPKPLPRVEAPPPVPNRDAEIAREKRDEKARLEDARRERERQATEAKRAADKKQAAEAERLRKAEAAAQAQREQAREQQLARLNEQLTGSGAPTSAGTAAQSAGPSASYAGRIKARIKPNVVFVDAIDGNPLASVEVQVAADGRITARRLLKPSGVAAWDEAVLRAIDKTELLPRDVDGRVPPTLLLDFRPRDF